MILTHGANSLPRYVEIGGRKYPTIQIGNLLWISENLDFKFSGCDIGSSGNPTTPTAWYYNNDGGAYGENGNKYGLLYNWYALDYLNQHLSELGVPPGWRVSSVDDWNKLTSDVGGLSVAGSKLKSVTGWNISGSEGDGTMTFEGFPAGGRYSNGNFYYIGSFARFWTSVEASENDAYNRSFDSSESVIISHNSKVYGYSIRLVKTVT